MTFVKVCGITREEDFRLAARLGADFLGFVFYRPSPRYIASDRAGEIGLGVVGPRRVGVFVDEEPELINEVVRLARLDLVQLHGDEDPDFNRAIAVPCWKALRIGSLADVDGLEAYRHWPGLLADSRVLGIPGGSGVALEAELAKEIVRRFPRVFMAGGIAAHNLARILALGPGGIDLSSGLEDHPGIKSPAKIQEIFHIVGALRETPSSFTDHQGEV